MAMKIVPVCLAKPTEAGPASEVAPTEIIPDQLSAASDESHRVFFASHVPPMEAVSLLHSLLQPSTNYLVEMDARRRPLGGG